MTTIALEARDLSRSFGGVQAVDNMSLSVRSGTVTGLIGPNGAGKSTFFNLVSGVLPSRGGTVILMGEDITGLASHLIARKGMVRTFQLARELGRLTVLENLLLAPQQQLGEQLVRVFRGRAAVRRQEAGLLQRADQVMDTVRLTALSDEYAVNLSGGQKKLLELGRALMINPGLILLDEPAAGVNPSLMAFLCDVIASLRDQHDKTVLIVEHDMDLVARLCDHVVVMAEGRHLVSGTFDQVTADERVIEAYLGGVQ